MPGHGLSGPGFILNGPQPDLDERYRYGLELVSEAASLALRHFRGRIELDIEVKGPQDLVSQADREVEALIRGRLAARFPDDGFLGEEGGFSVGAADTPGLWVVDPIDGTQPFLTGLGSWAVSIAFVYAGVLELGFVCCPVRDELFVGRRGHGSTLNGQPISVSAASRLDEGIVGIGYNPRIGADDILVIIERILRGGSMLHADGSGALSLCYVASGGLIAYVEPLIQSWDCFAGLVIVEAAGGRVNRFLRDGSLAVGGPVVAATPGLYATLADIVVEAGRDISR